MQTYSRLHQTENILPLLLYDHKILGKRIRTKRVLCIRSARKIVKQHDVPRQSRSGNIHAVGSLGRFEYERR